MTIRITSINSHQIVYHRDNGNAHDYLKKQLQESVPGIQLGECTAIPGAKIPLGYTLTYGNATVKEVCTALSNDSEFVIVGTAISQCSEAAKRSK